MQPIKHIVVSVNGDGEINLRVSCSCGWKPSMGGAKCYILPFLKTLLREHQGPGHSVDLRDPFMLMDGVNELPMLS
jgi:hypothetical protein